MTIKIMNDLQQAEKERKKEIAELEILIESNLYVEGNYYNNSAEKSNLAEVANEIQQLLEQLSQTNPTNTMTGKMKIAGEVIEQIESNPALIKRVLGALNTGGVSAFEQVLNHPAASLVIGALEEWQNSKS
ncbi:hypothetical protein [Planktothrix agardhii]|jgi:hypothetical protein|uniref:Uncharacterized protein n=2 Tax=Planktothrix agardhii TaxID=1160 RepID=A0A073CH38_PLAA1|nr:hypothetical protein [Planktothrix agardhii]KEI67008.1 hypothetical protein A19Y_2039 [Planktothrix agardhii NIVA-CYA 126/8]MCB8760153.1 hypothetical protein [Planktothrix agardhii 1813]MCB8786404.1 hypothetical protein [Planktothrix agardhii 1025]MCF3607139.1 hypothetical protein [Planktothrix agardhii 1033]MCF3611953.1 hypothetical protein [Planktothrix agardhii 1027]